MYIEREYTQAPPSEDAFRGQWSDDENTVVTIQEPHVILLQMIIMIILVFIIYNIHKQIRPPAACLSVRLSVHLYGGFARRGYDMTSD